MAAPTPDQEKLSKLVNKFRGISMYQNISTVPMEHATDLINCIVSPAGFLEKFRSPKNLVGSVIPTLFGLPVNFIDTLFMFTQGNGTRQLFFNADTRLAYYTDPETGAPLVLTPVATDATYNARTRYTSSNNLLFGVNGLTVWKWTGTQLLKFGLPQPSSPLTLGRTINIKSIQRNAGNVVTVSWVAGGNNDTVQNLPIGSLIRIVGSSDATLDGYYATTSLPAFTIGAPSFWSVTYNSATAGAVGPFVVGTITIFDNTVTGIAISNIKRLNGTVTVNFASGLQLFSSPVQYLITISGFGAPNTLFNGTFKATAGVNSAQLTFPQLGPDTGLIAGGGALLATGFTDVVSGRTWRYSWAISATGEEGPASDLTGPVPDSAAGTGVASNVCAFLTVPNPPIGYGIDSFFLYASEDGGGTWNTVIGPGSAVNPSDESWPLAISGILTDIFDDTLLDAAFVANFINYPPPQNAKFITKFQGRLFLGGMPDAPQDIVYSGYDQIYRGRPECSYPPFNRIRLAIGADTLAGFGVLLNGVIAWDNSNKMYMFSGTIQDITTTQPVQIADQLEEEPWQQGLASADSVQSTPRGVVWVGSDMTVKIWNGIFYGEIIGPRDLSVNFYPYMSRITPSMRPLIQSSYFNWLERDWYVINVAVDGSLSPNRLFFFDLSQEGSDNLGIWVSNIACDSIDVKVDSKGTRTLVASIGGQICQLNVSSTATNGIHQNPSATTAELDAFWESGYWQDQPHMTKMFRYGRLTTDQSGFNLITTVLNDETVRFASPNPWSKNLKLTPGGRFAVNRKGRRQKFRIEFPRVDVDASVIELYTTAIPLADI